jgi:hypothetical protein
MIPMEICFWTKNVAKQYHEQKQPNAECTLRFANEYLALFCFHCLNNWLIGIARRLFVRKQPQPDHQKTKGTNETRFCIFTAHNIRALHKLKNSFVINFKMLITTYKNFLSRLHCQMGIVLDLQNRTRERVL